MNSREILKQKLKEIAMTGEICAKWLPREKSSKGHIAKQLMQLMKLSPRVYRKLLANMSDTVETSMCAGDWTAINYEHVPSIAAKQYQKAFGLHDAEGYGKYKEGLKSGETKINAGAIFPHDVIVGIRCGDEEVGEAQWKALPDYLNDKNILPLCDTSGSMMCSAGGSKVTCYDISLALGLYISERQKGDFKNVVMTFSENPSLLVLKGDTVRTRLEEMGTGSVGLNTNIQKVFEKILSHATLHQVPQTDMPEYVLILSDMQFDQANGNEPPQYASYGHNYNKEPSYNPTIMTLLKKNYEERGYVVPKIIFWNLNASYDSVPVKSDEYGTALVSGFSPSILKSVLAAKNFSSFDIMMETIGSDRYKDIVA